jgi:hypothetical protein
VSLHYEMREPRPRPQEHVLTGATCDACGGDAYYPAHRSPDATLTYVRDDGKSNMDIWQLDLCTTCKDAVMQLLASIAKREGHDMPMTRRETFAATLEIDG